MEPKFEVGDLVSIKSYLYLEQTPQIGLIIGTPNVYGVYPVMCQQTLKQRYFSTSELEKLDD